MVAVVRTGVDDTASTDSDEGRELLAPAVLDGHL